MNPLFAPKRKKLADSGSSLQAELRTIPPVSWQPSRASSFPPSVGGLDLNSSNSGCARLGSGVAPPLGVVKEEVAVLIALVHRHRRAVGAAVRRAVDDEVPGAVEEEKGPAAVRRVSSGLYFIFF